MNGNKKLSHKDSFFTFEPPLILEVRSVIIFKFMRNILIPLLLLLPLLSKAQVVSVDPIFPQQNDTVTITFDATQGNGALDGVTPVFAHTGVITNLSSNGNDWRHVQGNWGTNDPNVAMTSLGNNLHEIKYHLNSFLWCTRRNCKCHGLCIPQYRWFHCGKSSRWIGYLLYGFTNLVSSILRSSALQLPIT